MTLSYTVLCGYFEPSKNRFLRGLFSLLLLTYSVRKKKNYLSHKQIKEWIDSKDETALYNALVKITEGLNSSYKFEVSKEAAEVLIHDVAVFHLLKLRNYREKKGSLFSYLTTCCINSLKQFSRSRKRDHTFYEKYSKHLKCKGDHEQL